MRGSRGPRVKNKDERIEGTEVEYIRTENIEGTKGENKDKRIKGTKGENKDERIEGTEGH